MNILNAKRKLLPMSGFYFGGGGGGTSATSTQTTSMPSWAETYAQETLAKQGALSDVPYQAYGGDRIQGFTPMQENARQAAANMGTSDITGQVAQRGLSTNYQPGQFSYQQASAPSLQNYQMGPAQQVKTNSFTGQGTANQYMNPYMQNVVDIQKREAQRQSGIQGTQQQAQATQAGAFGGSRDAIMRAERERNLGQQMNDIQAQGSNAAYQQAQQQFNAEQAARLQAQQSNQQAGLTVGAQNLNANLGVQQLGAGQNMQSQLANQQAGLATQNMGEQSKQFGSDLGLRGLGIASTAGAQQFQQGMDVNKLQSAYGAQQQAMGQQGLNQAYQDFLNQKAYPQQMINNMVGTMRGTPIGTTQTTTGTPGSPSTLQQLGSLGSIGYGLSQFYAEGGSVDSQSNIESIVHKLSDPQLAQAEQSARVRGDMEEMQIISMEKAARASMKRGIAAAPVDMNKMLPTEDGMARGGIVAFADRGLVGEDTEGEDEARAYMDNNNQNDQPQGAGNPPAYQNALDQMQAQASSIANAQYTPMKSEDYDAVIQKRMGALQQGLPDIYGEQKTNIAKMEEQNADNLKRGRGLAAIQAGAAMLEGPSAWHGLSKGIATFGDSYGAAIKAAQAQKQALQQMKFNIADSQRKEQMGLMKDSIAAADQARRDHQAAQQFGIDKAKALGSVYKGIAATSRPGAAPKVPAFNTEKVAIDSGVEHRLATEKPKSNETPEQQKARITNEVANRVLSLRQNKFVSSVSDIGPTKVDEGQAARDQALQLQREKEAAAARSKIAEQVDIGKDTRKLPQEEKDAIVEKRLKKQLGTQTSTAAELPPPPKVNRNSPAPIATTAPDISTVTGAPKGSKIGKLTPKGHEVLDSSGKLIGYAQ